MKMTRRAIVAGLAAAPLLSTPARAASGGSITRLHPALDALIDPTSAVEVIASGYRWTEGPVWVRDGAYLLFSDVPANVVYSWTRGNGARPFLSPSGRAGPIPPGIREAGANGLALDADGALIVADSGSRAIARVALATKRKTILADRFEGKRFNSCNDVAIGPGGAIYFTDPPYGLTDGDHSSLKELDFNGVFRLLPGGAVELIDRSLSRPNGVALSPTGDRLYVACSDEKRPEIRGYDLAADGSATGLGRQLVDFSAEFARKLPGLPDGLEVARTGHLFASGPGGLYIIAPDGTKLGMIAVGKAIANCAFGEDGKTLFLTASNMVARVRLKVSGW
ncbi:Gluconolactonase precursor [Sphingomonas jeddahensis]|uniref:Gluconolactonase n=2 Tax=Sphingomonas jeddahensis TaxID=1915074 RepID=A0A1V2EWV4_9SPHN|nr:Gluconolactonase precursor [Sphingomonas jeddahensis]